MEVIILIIFMMHGDADDAHDDGDGDDGDGDDYRKTWESHPGTGHFRFSKGG